MLLNRKTAGIAFLLLAGTALEAQQTTTHTNPYGDTVTDSRSYQNGQYTNDKTVTTPNGRAYTNDKTAGPNGSGGYNWQDTRTNANGGSVTDSRSLQNGQYTNDRSATTANGKTYSNDFSASRNSNGRLTTQDVQTGPNGRSRIVDTTHGLYRNKVSVTGRRGNTHTFFRRR